MKKIIHEAIIEVIEDKNLVIFDKTPLTGPDSILDSMALIDLCLLLQDRSAELGFKFDWNIDLADGADGIFKNFENLVIEFTRPKNLKT